MRNTRLVFFSSGGHSTQDGRDHTGQTTTRRLRLLRLRESRRRHLHQTTTPQL